MARQCSCGGIIREHGLTGDRVAWTCSACGRYEIHGGEPENEPAGRMPIDDGGNGLLFQTGCMYNQRVTAGTGATKGPMGLCSQVRKGDLCQQARAEGHRPFASWPSGRGDTANGPMSGPHPCTDAAYLEPRRRGVAQRPRKRAVTPTFSGWPTIRALDNPNAAVQRTPGQQGWVRAPQADRSGASGFPVGACAGAARGLRC